MVNEMIERVARAMSVKDKGGDYWDFMSEDGDGYGYVGKNEYRVMARAAIEAMRKPTEAMLDYRDAGVKQSDALLVWQHQIDEASK